MNDPIIIIINIMSIYTIAFVRELPLGTPALQLLERLTFFQ